MLNAQRVVIIRAICWISGALHVTCRWTYSFTSILKQKTLLRKISQFGDTEDSFHT
jgi:hypothetical protein